VVSIEYMVFVTYLAAEPTAPPQNIRVLHVENDTLLIRWDPPPRQHRNGILLGYKVSTTLIIISGSEPSSSCTNNQWPIRRGVIRPCPPPHPVRQSGRKISKIGATRYQILRLKCTKFDFLWGLQRSSRPLSCIKGAYFQGDWGGREQGKEREEKGREGRVVPPIGESGSASGSLR